MDPLVGMEQIAESRTRLVQGESMIRLHSFQQHLGLLEVCRVQALGEPAIDLLKQLPGVFRPALFLP